MEKTQRETNDQDWILQRFVCKMVIYIPKIGKVMSFMVYTQRSDVHSQSFVSLNTY